MRPSDLDPERWRRIDELFEHALDLGPDARAEFLADACSQDAELRSEVEALLVAHEKAGDHFDRPVTPLGATALLSEEASPEGRRVGPFKLVREIGRGGMGVVYSAEDTRLGRSVALKVLPPYLGLGREAKERFVAEAKAVAALDHTNIATLYEIDVTEAGQLYMAFALYHGETLDQRIARGRLPVADALAIARDIASGLSAAHARGVVHRDIKPSNVLLTDAGEVKLLDFGVAKVPGEDVTGEGVKLGTVAYMSPEQGAGARFDQRTDLWSLGVTLFEMLTGERPFSGENQRELLRRIAIEPPPRIDGQGSVTPDVARVVDRLLQKDPGHRYQDAGSLIEDLEALRAGEPISDTGSLASRALGRPVHAGPLRWRKAAALLAALGFLVAVAWYVTASSPEPAPGIERVAVLPLENLSEDPDQDYFVQGIHQALIAELGGLGSLDVVSRSSVMRFAERQRPVAQIAEGLGVDAFLQGSVLRKRDSLTVVTRLVASSSERRLWAETYRRHVSDVFEIADEVARAVAAEAQIELKPIQQDRLASAQQVRAEAYDAYTLGQFHLQRVSPEGLQQAENYLRLATDLDPDFAPAYVELASALGSGAVFGLRSPAETYPQTRELAATAMRLDSTLAGAHYLGAAVSFYWDWDWAAAEEQARHSLALNPSYAPAAALLSQVLAAAGRQEEALEAVERARELDGLVPVRVFMPALIRYLMRDFTGAVEVARQGLEFHVGFWQGHWLQCLSLVAAGAHDDALFECREAADRSGRTPQALAALGHALASSGREPEARAIIEELDSMAMQRYVGPAASAVIYGTLGQREVAFDLLERAQLERDQLMTQAAHYAFFDPLRADPRFDTILAAIGRGR